MSGVKPISCGSEYHCIADFEQALFEWETKYGHQFRVGSSEILKNKYGMNDEVFEYRVLVLQCVHYGNPRDRAKTKRRSSVHLPCGCAAMMRLNFSVKEHLLRITSFIDVHTGHEIQPGEHVNRKRLAERRRSVKRPRTSDATGSPAVIQDLDYGIKPKIPFPMISALAIYNSPNGKLFTKKVYLFFETYFPFYRTAYGSWKNTVRHALHTHAYFEKSMAHDGKKEHLVFSIVELEKFKDDVYKFANKFPDRNVKTYGLSNPDHWDLMAKGELKNIDVPIYRPKAIFHKRIKVESEEESDDMEEIVITDSPRVDVKLEWAGDENTFAPSTPLAAPLPISFDYKVPLIGDVKPFAEQALNVQMPLHLPGAKDYSGLHTLAQVASAINYNDINLL